MTFAGDTDLKALGIGYEYVKEQQMGALFGFIFLLVTMTFIGLSLLAIVRTGFARLNSSIGIGRDGFRPGSSVPSWSLPDITGQVRNTPSETHWQLLIFTNRSLVAFPELVAGMRHLQQAFPELEILLLSLETKDVCEAMAEGLELHIPIVDVDESFYERFRVRVMPFTFLLDPQGVVY